VSAEDRPRASTASDTVSGAGGTDEAPEPSIAEARARARAERRAAREERLRDQLARVSEVVDEERERFEKEVARRIRDEGRRPPSGWTPSVSVGREATPETRRAIEGGE